MNNVTEKTHQLVQNWIHAKKCAERRKQELNSAEVDLLNATNALGKWLVPEDGKVPAQLGETFNIWFGSGILQAIKLTTGDYLVTWRKEPDGKDRLEFGV